MSKHLRIALVFDDSLDRPDGVQQYMRVLGEWLKSQGHFVKYLVGETKNAGSIQPQVHSMAKNITVNGNQNVLSLPLPASVKNINEVLNKEQFDVVHIMMPYNPLMSGRLITRLPESTRLVGTFHIVAASSFERFGSKLLGFTQQRSLKRFNQIVSVSTAAQNFAEQYFNITSTVIPNAVDQKKFKSGERKPFLRPRDYTITFLGRLVERKGADHLLKSLLELKNSRGLSDIGVHICGDGPMRAELEAFCQDHFLSDTVQFHGFIDEDEKADYLASSDFAVFPSTGGESFGIVLVEAMSTGQTVVLGGNNDGYRTVLHDKDFLFEPAEHKQLATKLEHLMKSKSAYSAALKRQKQLASEYDIESVGPKIEAIYRA